jgi:ATP-dependent helicase/nuclease subunit B
MLEDLFRSMEPGATVITGSRRLARVLKQSFHARQREQGRSVWETPDILPYDAFLGRAWRDWVLRAESCPTLLDALQEQLVWEQVIRESPAGESLLRIPETARGAMEAWQLVQAYRLPVDGRFEGSEDWAAFADWSRAFRKHCQSNNWLERARLADVLAELWKSGEIARLEPLFKAGFAVFSPQEAAFFEALGDAREVKLPTFQPAPERRKLRDSTEEIRAAAGWARKILERDPAAQIGVIVPELTSLRSKVERLFRETLDPGGEFDDRERSFHLSLGPALDQYPVVRGALLMLEFAMGGLALPQAGMLLRSPFLGGGQTEWTERALLDVKLRRQGVWKVTADVLPFENALPYGHGSEAAVEQRASEWSRDFSKILEAFGWPGDRALSSREYQVITAWHGMLSSLAALDAVAPPMSFEQALTRLRKIATESTFQIENEGAPVQIMGLLEASGLRFDHLWVMGLHDQALPAPANPNPFLPISLQRERQLPHSSAERELEFANELMERLLGSARELVLSYPETEGDRGLGPSPVAGGPWLAAAGAPSPENWMDRMRAAPAFEELLDDAGPAVLEMSQPGGTSLFKDMAACSFRAFAKYRLGAKPLEDTDLGLSYKDRGNAAHKALQFIWEELGSQARLRELPVEELREMLVRNVAAAVGHLGPGIGRNLERQRLEKLLAEWLEIEKSREPFTVRKPEEERVVTIGGVQVRTRADRIDQVASGREIILDYKTGLVKTAGWDGERPDEPQLPLYCATSERPIAGAAFALIRAGELGFKGMTEPGAALPDLKKMSVDRNISFDQLIAQWKRVLERLAAGFLAGQAQVDPKHDACDFCGLRALCRIREFENDRG